MNFPNVDFSIITPSLIVLATALVAMVLVPFLKEKQQQIVAHLSWIGLGLALVSVSQQIGKNNSTFDGMFLNDDFSQFFNAIFIVGSMLTIFMSVDYLKRKENEHGEYYPLILFATYGMMVMASTANLLVIFLGLEIMSVSLYVLAGFARTDLKSTEASIKYFLLGAFATGFTVFGIAFIYGSTGTFNLHGIIDAVVQNGGEVDTFMMIGGALMTIGFGFKIAAVPFHMWAPDAYEGAPSPVTGFMSAGPKAAAFAAMLRIFSIGFSGVHTDLQALFWVLSVTTMTVGNIMAIRQNNIKRMLAFSSIAHAGYILIALVVSNGEASSAAALYLLAYAMTNLGAFIVISLVDSTEPHNDVTSIDAYTGLARRRPFLGIALTLFMISLAGFPPTAGFMGKFVLFRAAVAQGYYSIVVIAVLNSLVSVYYYLRVVVKMFMAEPDGESANVPASAPLSIVALVFAAAAVFLIGLYPQIWFPFSGLITFGIN